MKRESGRASKGGKGGAAVASVDVHTPPDGEYMDLAPEAIVTLGLNPRRTFDEEKMEELTQSVRDKGVLEPLLVRPLPKPKGKARFELIAGERRWRAATRAKRATVPVISRAYTDAEALEIAVVENEQREDVPELEKAEGYKRLMEEHGYSAERLAARIGKSEAHVHSTVKLLALPEVAKENLNKGVISKSHAEVIARVPSEDGRNKLAREIIFGGGGGTPQPVSVREAKRYAEKYTAELSKAEFDPTDEKLIESMGACTTCPFKSGNNRLDYPDGRADICNNVACFKEKTEAGRAAKITALTTTGAVALPKAEVEKYLPYGYLYGQTPYVELKDSCNEDKGKYRSYRQLVGKELGKSVKLFVAVHSRTGAIVELALRSEVNAVLKSKHGIDLNARHGASKEEANRRLKSQARGVVVLNVLGLVAAHFQKQCTGGFAAKFDKNLRVAALSMIGNVSNDALREVSKRRSLEVKGQYPQFGRELAKLVPKMSGPELFGLLMEASVAETLHYWKGPYSSGVRDHAQEVLKAAGINLSALEAGEVKAIKERRAARAKKPVGKKAAKKSAGKAAGGKQARQGR